jgi:hypothetical protein
MTTEITITLPESSHPYAETIWPAIARLASDDGYHWVAQQIYAQTEAIAEPKEYGSIVLARSDERAERCRWVSPSLKEPGWYSEHGEFVGGFQMLRDVEVLRIGVGGEYNHPLQQLRDILFRSPSGSMTNREGAEAYKALRFSLGRLLAAPPQTDESAGALLDPSEVESSAATSSPALSSPDHVSLAVVLRILDEVRTASITATEQEAVRRCHNAVMVLPTYVGCWP